MGRAKETIARILDAAVARLNAQGLAHVSLRAIADAAGIRHSHLAYHFPDRDTLLLAVYARMKAEMDDAVFPEGGDAPGLEHYHSLLKRISVFHRRYRFFYLDLAEIARSHRAVIARYRKTIAQRFDEHDRLCAVLIERGLFQPEGSPGFYRATFRTIWVMSTFWLQHELVLGRNHPVYDGGNDVKHAWDVLLPHLTRAGLRAFRSIAEAEGWDTARRPQHAHHLKSLS